MLRRSCQSVLAVLTVGLLALSVAGPAWAQQRGGVVNWFVYQDPGRLDVFTETPLGVQQATAGIYSGLLHFDPDKPSEIVPDLALSYAASDGGKRYTFKLRQGVKWHDGKPFSADDVKATFDHLLNPDVKAARCGAVVRPVLDSVKAVDAHTVQFDLKFPAATFIPSIASAWCRIAAKHVLEKYKDLQTAEAQIGTGPFKFKRYDRGAVIEWERNPDYFVPGLPYLDGVKQFILVGEPRQVAAAKAGQVHLWDTWPPMSKSNADEVVASRGNAVEVYRWSISTVWALHLNTQKPPFDNKDIRRAVHLALDRNELFEKAFEGIGTPCAVLEPSTSGEFALSEDELAKTPGCRKDKAADLAEAAMLVKKHYPNGVEYEAVTRTVGNYVDRIQLIVSQLKKVGLNGTIKTYEGAAGYTVYAKGDFQMIGTQDTAMFLPDPSGLFSILYTKNAGRNWQKWVDPKVDGWAEEALRETDINKRKALYHQMQRYLLNEDNAAPIIGWIEGWFFYDKKLQNYKPAPTIYDNNTFMKVWLQK